jgi:predicted aminopeptidase
VFNESFATLVEQEGTARWLERRGDRAGLCRFLAGIEREREVHRLLAASRRRLNAIYASGATDEVRRREKAEEIENLRNAYRRLRATWREPPFFDAWFEADLNNASLGAVGAYDQLVGTLRVILDGERGNLPAFYRRAAELGRLRKSDRADVLRHISTPEESLRPDARCEG